MPEKERIFLDEEPETIDFFESHGYINRERDINYYFENEDSIEDVNKILCRGEGKANLFWSCRLEKEYMTLEGKKKRYKYWTGDVIDMADPLIIKSFGAGMSVGGDYNTFEINLKIPNTCYLRYSEESVFNDILSCKAREEK